MSTFPKRFDPEVEVTEVDLDQEDVRYRGEKLTEERAEHVAADFLSQSPERRSAT